MRAVAAKYNIDKSLLSRRVLNKCTGTQGRKTALSERDEHNLASNLKIMAKWGFPLSRDEVLSVVQEYVEINGIKTSFKNGKPGHDWFKAFRARNNLTLKKPEPLDQNRRRATSDPFIVFDFYDKLEEVMSELNILDKPHLIWNLDETSFSCDPSKAKGVAGIGQKFHRNITGTGRDNTTVMACVSAAGRALPPLIVFEAAKLWTNWKGTRDIPGTFYAVAEKGFMTAAVFSDFFCKFCEIVQERPLLLIFDGHLSHLDISIVEKAVKERVVIIKLPAHTTDLLQPLDKCVFRPLKCLWEKRLIMWQRENQRSLAASKSEFVDLICEIWHEALKSDNIISGFRTTGIFPFNRNQYPISRLDPVKFKRYLELGLEKHKNEADSICNAATASEFLPLPRLGLSSVDTISALPSTSSQSSGPTSPALPMSEDTSPAQNSFENLLLSKIKRTEKQMSKRRRVDPTAKVITSEEYAQFLKEKKTQTQKKKKDTTKPAVKKTRSSKTDTKADSTDSSDEGEDWQESGDSLDDVEVIDTDAVEMTKVDDVKPGDFVLALFESCGKRNSFQYKYVATVQTLLEDGDMQIMCLNCLNDDKTVFRLNENDVSIINISKLIGKLPVPIITGKGRSITYVFPGTVDVFEKL